MRRAATLIAVLLALTPLCVSAQITGADQQRPGPRAQRSRDFGSPEEEMLRRAEIRREEATHKEMVERADEAAQIGDDLLTSFKKNNSLTREDLKRIERLEKLARKIRGSAGGSDDKDELSDPPVQIEGAVTRLAKLTGDLKESVSKTSRLVISGHVIRRSNEMIELIRHIRTFKMP
jgi:PP-loop superfamily ATP-utilizing enzyme